MQTLSLFCKSYLPDLERAKNLVESIRSFNRDQIPFYLCVPRNELATFKKRLGEESVLWITDEDVVSASGQTNLT
ncbi:MAG: hypothetical protein ABL878_03085, partial [Burkholderiales bacterium]